MSISTKLVGLVVAGLATTGVAAAAIVTTTSASHNKNVSADTMYRHPSTGGSSARHASSRHPRRQLIVTLLTSHYQVTRVPSGHSVSVWNMTGGRWRAVGRLRWNDRHVAGVGLGSHHQTTVLVAIGHRLTAVVVPANAAIVIADNGAIGTLTTYYLTKVPTVAPSTVPPTVPPSPSQPTTPITGSPAPGPTPTGSQAPIVNGLNPRISSKW